MIEALIPAGLIMGGSVVSLRAILRETLLISNQFQTCSENIKSDHRIPTAVVLAAAQPAFAYLLPRQ